MAQTAKTPEKNKETQIAELSVFDVKELYDRAYDRKAATSEMDALFKEYLSQAVKMDLAYRRQLSNNMTAQSSVISQKVDTTVNSMKDTDAA